MNQFLVLKSNPIHLEQGDIILLDFSPQAGHEQANKRPALIVSHGVIDPNNPFLAMVAPITNKIKGYAFEVPVPENIQLLDNSNLSGVVLSDHAKSLDIISRKYLYVGSIPCDSECMINVKTNIQAIIY